MKSGIYLLQFSSGKFYVGKCLNLEKRFNQHKRDFENGEHTFKMQEAFLKAGLPTLKVLSYCHPDLLDLLERYWFNKLVGKDCLNTVTLLALSAREESLLEDFQHCLNLGIFDLLETISSQEISVEELGLELEKELLKSKKDSRVLELLEENKKLKVLVNLLEVRLSQASLPWYKKLMLKLPFKK